jgi:hypothetical protein
MDDTFYQRKMKINSLPGRPIIKEWKLSSVTLMRILSVILSDVWLAVNSKYQISVWSMLSKHIPFRICLYTHSKDFPNGES